MGARGLLFAKTNTKTIGKLWQNSCSHMYSNHCDTLNDQGNELVNILAGAQTTGGNFCDTHVPLQPPTPNAFALPLYPLGKI